MMRRALAIACICACTLAPRSAAFASGDQATGTLARGGTYVVQQDPASPVTAIALWFRAPAAGYDGTTPGISRLAAAAAASSPLVTGKSLAHFVRDLGGRFSINVFADLVGVDALVPNDQARRVVAAMTAAYFAPTIDDASLTVARRDEAVAFVTQRYSLGSTLQTALAMALFARGPHHDPLLPTSVAAIGSIPRDAVSAYAQRAFASSNAVLAVVGNVSPDIVRAVTDGTPGQGSAPMLDSVPADEPLDMTIDAPVAGIGIAWSGPSITDEKAATAMDFLADQLFSSPPPHVNGQFVTLHAAGMFFATISGPTALATKDRVLARIEKLQSPLDAATFARLHAAFLLRIRQQTQAPDEVADEIGWYASEGNAAYAPGDHRGAYWTAATSLTPEYVASIATRYFSHSVVVTTKQSVTP